MGGNGRNKKIETLRRIHKLFEEYVEILEREGDEAVRFAKAELKRHVQLLEELFGNLPEENELDDIIRAIKSNYKQLYPPRAGLSEFFVWRERLTERRTANIELDRIKEQLRTIFDRDK